MIPRLGRLVMLQAASVWANEPSSFTPWLAQNLDLLRDALQIGELELKGTEVHAGDFRIDILAQDERGNSVIVENQFGPTDHKHLGQLISYVASQGVPSTVVWVAERIKNDHRAAIDWLNANTSEGYDFFAVEIEALKIGDSDPAPFFNVVAKPNAWAKRVTAIARETSATEDSGGSAIRSAYWAAFGDYLRAHDPSFSIRRKNADHYFFFSIGTAYFNISATISTQKKRIGVELYIEDDALKFSFNSLRAESEVIDQEFGEPLEWQELPAKKASRIAIFRQNVDPADKNIYPILFEWMLSRMQKFKKVFSSRVKALALSRDDEHPSNSTYG